MSEPTAEVKQTGEETGTTIKPEDIHLPSNSFWPIILAFGFSMIAFGLAVVENQKDETQIIKMMPADEIE